MDIIAVIEKIAPRRQKMNYANYLELAGNSEIVEWVNGEVIHYMPPTITHQDLSGFLATLLRLYVQFFKLGMVHYAPFEVKLWSDGPSREPDILFVAQENLVKLGEKRFSGAPDLIIEIISPSSITEDRVRKFSEYEQAGVREYWLIDPRPRQQQADFYALAQDRKFQAGPLDEAGRYHSQILHDFWLNVDWLRQEPLPNPQLALAEIMVSITTLPTEVKASYQTLIDHLSK